MTGFHASDLSLMESSCRPSAVCAEMDEKNPTVITVVATTDVLVGDHISISYVDPALGSYSRRRKASEHYFFRCECIRCMDPSEFGLYVNSICCKKCTQLKKMSMVVSTNPREMETAPWKCEDCGYAISGTEFETCHMSLSSKHSYLTPNDMSGHEKFIKENQWPKGLLHPTHEFIINSKTKIVLYKWGSRSEQFLQCGEMLRDVEHFYRQLFPTGYNAYCVHLMLLATRVMKMIEDKRCRRLKPKMLQEKLKSVENEVHSTPSSYILSYSDILDSKSYKHTILRLISVLKLST